MARGQAMSVTGDRQLIRALARLPIALRRELWLCALMKAALPIQRTARTLARKDRGDLARAIQRKALPGGPPAVVIRPDYRKAPHAHLVEFGTGPRTSVRDGRTVVHGRMPATPFMRPAFRRNERKAIRIAGQEIGQDIQRIARKEARRV